MFEITNLARVAHIGRRAVGAIALGSWGFWAGSLSKKFPVPFDLIVAGSGVFFGVLGGLAGAYFLFRDMPRASDNEQTKKPVTKLKAVGSKKN